MSEASTKIPGVGVRAPAFTLKSAAGGTERLSAYKGRRVVVYFYPKDDTPGCTIEANEFNKALSKFEKAKVAVFGISPDPIESHQKFTEKCALRFPLLSDPEHKIAEKYGVWVEKNMYGRKFWGVQRATFLIGENGRVLKAWPKVRPKGHAADVLKAALAT